MGDATCVQCGIQMITKTGRRRFCSKRCMNAARGDRYYFDVICTVCGAAFRSPNPEAKLCSDDCKSRLYSRPGAPRSRPGAPRSCPACGGVIVLSRHTYCSAGCRVDAARRRGVGPLTTAVESQDWPNVIAELLSRTEPSGACRLWTGRTRGGYPQVRVRGRERQAHRLMALAARGGEDLGHMPVHHICANSLCIEPSHLQVVTPEENTAEMLERSHYLARIHSLEQALAAAAPSHPLLRQ